MLSPLNALAAYGSFIALLLSKLGEQTNVVLLFVMTGIV